MTTIRQAGRTVEQPGPACPAAPVGTGGTADPPISRAPHPAVAYVHELVARSWDPRLDEPLLLAPASWLDIDPPIRDAIAAGLVARRHDGVLTLKSNPPALTDRGTTTNRKATP